MLTRSRELTILCRNMYRLKGPAMLSGEVAENRIVVIVLKTIKTRLFGCSCWCIYRAYSENGSNFQLIVAHPFKDEYIALAQQAK